MTRKETSFLIPKLEQKDWNGDGGKDWNGDEISEFSVDLVSHFCLFSISIL